VGAVPLADCGLALDVGRSTTDSGVATVAGIVARPGAYGDDRGMRSTTCRCSCRNSASQLWQRERDDAAPRPPVASCSTTSTSKDRPQARESRRVGECVLELSRRGARLDDLVVGRQTTAGQEQYLLQLTRDGRCLHVLLPRALGVDLKLSVGNSHLRRCLKPDSPDDRSAGWRLVRYSDHVEVVGVRLCSRQRGACSRDNPLWVELHSQVHLATKLQLPVRGSYRADDPPNRRQSHRRQPYGLRSPRPTACVRGPLSLNPWRGPGV
jgi:hypothetical protein